MEQINLATRRDALHLGSVHPHPGKLLADICMARLTRAIDLFQYVNGLKRQGLDHKHGQTCPYQEPLGPRMSLAKRHVADAGPQTVAEVCAREAKL